MLTPSSRRTSGGDIIVWGNTMAGVKHAHRPHPGKDAFLAGGQIINILIIVDVENALASGDLGSNVWMLDTGKFSGTQEAGNELITTANAGDTLTWSLAAIDPASNLTWGPGQPFTGQAVPSNIDPTPVPNTQQYNAQFLVPGGTAAGTQYQYSVTLSMNNKLMTFDPFLKLANAT